MARAQVHQRRANKRGLATRQAMLDAAVRSLASGDPAAVSASRIAKESGATWGAVQYQFGDVDGFWAAVLHRTAERRDATFSALSSVKPDAPLRERVGAIIDTLYHGLASPEGTAAAEQAMRTEGLMVDPVYTAKALALVSRYAAGGNVVFWHTGGQLDVAMAAEAGR